MTIFTDPRHAAAYYWYIRNSEYTVKSVTGDTAKIPAHTPKLWQRIPRDLLRPIEKIYSIPSGFSTGPWGIPSERPDPIREVFNLDVEQRRTQYAKQRHQAYNDLLRHTGPISYVRGIQWYGDPNDIWICGDTNENDFEYMEFELGAHLAEYYPGYITHISFDGQLRQVRDRSGTPAPHPPQLTQQIPYGTVYRVIP